MSKPDITTEKPVIWCLMDGRTGHQNQVLGLAEALDRHIPVNIKPVDVSSLWKQVRQSVSPQATTQPPALVIGAGHRSHVPLMRISRKTGAKSIVLMKPTVSLQRFDLCLIPSVHELATLPANVVETTGVLNRIQPSHNQRPGEGLCLIGGPSSHYSWSDHNVMRQVEKVVADKSINWTIATSRRTPAAFVQQAHDLCPHITVVQPNEVDRDWLPTSLASVSTAWVSEDSVSMVYEALTAGAQVGIIELARKRINRVTECTDSLVRDGRVIRWHRWRHTKQLPTNSHKLNEADRCAQAIINRGLLVPEFHQLDQKQGMAA